jgi:hypothetical protein
VHEEERKSSCIGPKEKIAQPKKKKFLECNQERSYSTLAEEEVDEASTCA